MTSEYPLVMDFDSLMKRITREFDGLASRPDGLSPQDKEDVRLLTQLMLRALEDRRNREVSSRRQGNQPMATQPQNHLPGGS